MPEMDIKRHINLIISIIKLFFIKYKENILYIVFSVPKYYKMYKKRRDLSCNDKSLHLHPSCIIFIGNVARRLNHTKKYYAAGPVVQIIMSHLSF